MSQSQWVAGLILLTVAACQKEPARLISPDDIQGDALPQPLSDIKGDADQGKVIFSARDRGHCVLCHSVDGLDAEFQGNVGPNLTGVGNRLSEGQIRLRIADYQEIKPGALMPSYYRTHGFSQVGEVYRGKTVLTGQDIEHLVTYLVSLKETSP